MRILAASPTYFPIVGGAELLIDDVMTMLSETNEARLLTPVLPVSSKDFWVDDAKPAPATYDVVRFEDRFNLLDIRGHRLTRGLIPPMSLSAVRAISREIKRFRADVLVTFFGVPYGLPSLIARLRHKIPLIVVVCGSDVPSPRTRPVPLWSSYIRRITNAADRAVYVSETCFHALHPGELRPDHDFVIHGGVDSSKLEQHDRHAMRARLGALPNDIVLFTLSRLGPEKRVDVVIRAFAELLKTVPNVRLVVGGLGSELPALRELASDLGVAGRVVFTGYIDEEKGDYFAAADIFIFHSLFETFGQVLAEAMSMGKPVVTVRAGAIPEVVDDGDTGLIVEPEDPIALARAVETLVRDDGRRNAMGEAGRAKAQRFYSWHAQAQAWASVLDVSQPLPAMQWKVEDDVTA